MAFLIDNNVPSQNHIINGGMTFWQRQITFALSGGAGQYTADRWFVWSGTAGHALTVTKQAGENGYGTADLRIARNAGISVANNHQLLYNFESTQAAALAGKTVTLQFRAFKGADFSSSNLQAQIIYGTGGTDRNWITQGFTGAVTLSKNFVLTTSAANYSMTVTLPSSVNQLAVVFYSATTGTAGANDWYQIKAIALYEGGCPQTFRMAGGTLAGELALCQRYYEKSYDLDTAPGSVTLTGNAFGRAANVNDVIVPMSFKAAKRITPTTNIYSVGSGAVGNARDATAVADRACVAGEPNIWGASSLYSSAGAFTTNNLFRWHWTADAEI